MRSGSWGPEDGPEYQRIGDVARTLGLTPSAIRFYLRHFFPYIRPIRTKTHRYLFDRRDLQMLRVVLILRKQYGLSVRQALERLQELVNTCGRDPFAIERELLGNQAAAQPELPLQGLRESGAKEVELQLFRLKEALAKAEQELSQTKQLCAHYLARLGEMERHIARVRMQMDALRMRVAQAVKEIMLEVAEESFVDS